MELSLKQLELNRAVSESIDLDEEVFINQFNLHDTRNLHTDLEKSGGFNTCFVSDYCESPITALPSTVEAEIALLDFVIISVLSIEKYLASCADSALMGKDLVPSFIARDCGSQLAPLVAEPFYWILKNQKWPTIWETSKVSPLHKSGSTTLISNYRPISILPVLSLVLKRSICDYLFPIIRPLIVRGQHIPFQNVVRLANSSSIWILFTRLVIRIYHALPYILIYRRLSIPFLMMFF